MSSLPRLSILAPSFNQGAYIEQTIRSVLDQDYPALEYMVVDGGSTDGSVEIIRKHAPRLAWWVSEPDKGPYDAINKGFARSSGEIMAWLNSDDQYLPGALRAVGEIFARFPEVEWLTSATPVNMNAEGQPVFVAHLDGFNRSAFLRGQWLFPDAGRGWIQQESTFWRRSLWEKAGGRLDTSYSLAADYDLWARFWKHARLYGVKAQLGCFRQHDAQRSRVAADAYQAEARESFRKHGGRPYWAVEKLFRRTVGRRLASFARRRSAFRPLLSSLGLIYPTELVVRDGDGWKIEPSCIS
ncbi:MAG TPA: glycosyltransferase family 2 protein [Planctomycetota bacterium]|nr:glycosyltransferase family 2 protein [Planctomycetota bacterium]